MERRHWKDRAYSHNGVVRTWGDGGSIVIHIVGKESCIAQIRVYKPVERDSVICIL